MEGKADAHTTTRIIFIGGVIVAKEVVKRIKLQIEAGKATPAPPVGTVLGPAGINLGEFCTKFNEATDKLLKDESDKDFVLDLAGCDYVASSGLRGILAAQKIMTSRGGMVVKNVCDSIMEVFEMTAFTDILTIE